MMPKNKLSRKQMTRLHIFSDEKHDKQAQEKKFNTIKISEKSKKN
jgi:ribosomal protein L13